MTSKITNWPAWGALVAGVLAATTAQAQLPKNLDDEYWSENRSSKLHGKSAAVPADDVARKLALTTPVAGDPKAIDAKNTDALMGMSGQIVTVAGIVTSVFHSEKSDTRFLNFTKDRNGFSVVIFGSSVKDFAAVGDPLEFYKGKRVQVSGVLTTSKGRPSIVVKKPDQMVLVR